MKRLKYSILAAAAALPAAGILFASAAGPNLVTNPTFDNDHAGWTPFSISTIGWENGALAVINNYQGTGNSYFSAQQCINGVQEGVDYTFSADAFVGLDQPEPNTRAVLYAYFYPGPDCTGQLMSAGESSGASTPAQRGQWITLSKTVTAPAGAQSFYFRPTATKEPKPYASSIPETFTVLYDNFYFGEAEVEQPEPEPPVENDPQPDPDPDPTPDPEPQDDPIVGEPVEDPTPDPEEETPEAEEETDEPDAPEVPGTPETPEEPWTPQFPWEPPAPQVPDAPAPEAPSQPEPEQPQVEDQVPPTDEPAPEAPADDPAPAPGTVGDPLPPDTGEGLAGRATSPWGALVMSMGLGLASLGAAALGAARRK